MFCKKGVLRNFEKIIGKHLCQSHLFNKVADLRPKACNFIKKETLAQVFSYEFCEISKSTYFYRTPLDDCLKINSLENEGSRFYE